MIGISTIRLADGYIPDEIRKVGRYWRFRNKKYRKLDKAIFDWYRLQVKGGHV